MFLCEKFLWSNVFISHKRVDVNTCFVGEFIYPHVKRIRRSFLKALIYFKDNTDREYKNILTLSKSGTRCRVINLDNEMLR